MRPEQILDMQADLLHFSEKKVFQEITAGIIGSAKWMRQSGAGGRGAARYMQTPREDATATMIAQTMPNHIRAAYAYRVTADMCSVLEFAASQLDETDTFDRNLAPTGCGLVRFDKPLPIHDARGRLMLIHWCLWGPATIRRWDGDMLGKAGIAVSWFNDHFEQPDFYASEIMASYADSAVSQQQILDAVGRWGFIGVDVVEQGHPIGSALSLIDQDTAAGILADGDTPQPHTNTHRYLHALWLLLNQTITKTEDEYVRKTALKRAQRIGLPGRVTVVTLRRTVASRNQGESLVEWSHRWIVRGHWAWRKCGAEHPHAQEYEKGWRVRVWIGLYEKGPEDKPLIVTEKVFNLSR